MQDTSSVLSVESLSDHELIVRTEVCAKAERSATTRLIDHLREIERRKVYCDLGYGSLHAYCHKHLKLSEGSAQRRICVLKLTRELPELSPLIESGELNLTVAARLQSFFQQEGKLTHLHLEKKRKIAREVSNKSMMEVETILRGHSQEPERHQPESIRVISETHVRISFNLRHDEFSLLDRARGLLAHRYPQGMNFQELSVGMALQVIQTLDPAETKTFKRSASPVGCEKMKAGSWDGKIGSSDRRTAGAELKHELWKRDLSKCRNCGTYYRVQEEHDYPWAMGGASSLENMLLLCHKCNLRAAIRRFGLKKIEKEQRKGRE